MRKNRNPAPVGLTSCGAKARKVRVNYSQVAPSRQVRIGHRLWPAVASPPVVIGGQAWPRMPGVPGISRSSSPGRCDINVAPETCILVEMPNAVDVCRCDTKPFAALSQGIQQRLLTSARKAVSLQPSKHKRCVDLHPKPGLFLFHPAIEFAPSVGESVRPPEPFVALRTLGAFLLGGICHE